MATVKQMKFKVLGSDDSINTCDCCGKTDLKATWAVLMTETGEILHYGSTCVTRNTAIKNPEVAAQIYKQERIDLATLKLRQSEAWRALQSRFALRTAMKIAPGKVSMDFVRDAVRVCDAQRIEIAAEFDLKPYELQA